MAGTSKNWQSSLSICIFWYKCSLGSAWRMWSRPSVVKTLKGGTSRVLRAEFVELEEFLWGESFWADGYFAATVGVVEGSVVTQYIREQCR